MENLPSEYFVNEYVEEGFRFYTICLLNGNLAINNPGLCSLLINKITKSREWESNIGIFAIWETPDKLSGYYPKCTGIYDEILKATHNYQAVACWTVRL